MKVKRADLIQQLSDHYGYTKKDAANVIDDFTSVVLNNLEQGNEVSVRNLGQFHRALRKERSCPNPVTGERVVIPAHFVPKFSPSHQMRVSVRLWEDNVDRGLT